MGAGVHVFVVGGDQAQPRGDPLEQLPRPVRVAEDELRGHARVRKHT